MKAFVIGICVIAFSLKLPAQRIKNEHLNGVYLTLDDYLHHHLTHSFISKTKGFRLRTPRMNRIKLITPDSTYVYELTQIYGYCEDGINWCYRSGELVEIMGYQCTDFITQEGLWIFRRPEWAESSPNYTFFFSKKPTDPLRWFSRRNLKDAFKKDLDFLSLLSKVRWSRVLDTSDKTGQPLVLDVFATSHHLRLRSSKSHQ